LHIGGEWTCELIGDLLFLLAKGYSKGQLPIAMSEILEAVNVSTCVEGTEEVEITEPEVEDFPGAAGGFFSYTCCMERFRGIVPTDSAPLVSIDQLQGM
jgi:hypothetical protein